MEEGEEGEVLPQSQRPGSTQQHNAPITDHGRESRPHNTQTLDKSLRDSRPSSLPPINRGPPRNYPDGSQSGPSTSGYGGGNSFDNRGWNRYDRGGRFNRLGAPLKDSTDRSSYSGYSPHQSDKYPRDNAITTLGGTNYVRTSNRWGDDTRSSAQSQLNYTSRVSDSVSTGVVSNSPSSSGAPINAAPPRPSWNINRDSTLINSPSNTPTSDGSRIVPRLDRPASYGPSGASSGPNFPISRPDRPREREFDRPRDRERDGDRRLPPPGPDSASLKSSDVVMDREVDADRYERDRHASFDRERDRDGPWREKPQFHESSSAPSSSTNSVARPREGPWPRERDRDYGRERDLYRDRELDRDRDGYGYDRSDRYHDRPHIGGSSFMDASRGRGMYLPRRDLARGPPITSMGGPWSSWDNTYRRDRRFGRDDRDSGKYREPYSRPLLARPSGPSYSDSMRGGKARPFLGMGRGGSSGGAAISASRSHRLGESRIGGSGESSGAPDGDEDEEDEGDDDDEEEEDEEGTGQVGESSSEEEGEVPASREKADSKKKKSSSSVDANDEDEDDHRKDGKSGREESDEEDMELNIDRLRYVSGYLPSVVSEDLVHQVLLALDGSPPVIASTSMLARSGVQITKLPKVVAPRVIPTITAGAETLTPPAATDPLAPLEYLPAELRVEGTLKLPTSEDISRATVLSSIGASDAASKKAKDVADQLVHVRAVAAARLAERRAAYAEFIEKRKAKQRLDAARNSLLSANQSKSASNASNNGGNDSFSNNNGSTDRTSPSVKDTFSTSPSSSSAIFAFQHEFSANAIKHALSTKGVSVVSGSLEQESSIPHHLSTLLHCSVSTSAAVAHLVQVLRRVVQTWDCGLSVQGVPMSLAAIARALGVDRLNAFIPGLCSSETDLVHSLLDNIDVSNTGDAARNALLAAVSAHRGKEKEKEKEKDKEKRREKIREREREEKLRFYHLSRGAVVSDGIQELSELIHMCSDASYGQLPSNSFIDDDRENSIGNSLFVNCKVLMIVDDDKPAGTPRLRNIASTVSQSLLDLVNVVPSLGTSTLVAPLFVRRGTLALLEEELNRYASRLQDTSSVCIVSLGSSNSLEVAFEIALVLTTSAQLLEASLHISNGFLSINRYSDITCPPKLAEKASIYIDLTRKVHLSSVGAVPRSLLLAHMAAENAENDRRLNIALLNRARAARAHLPVLGLARQLIPYLLLKSNGLAFSDGKERLKMDDALVTDYDMKTADSVDSGLAQAVSNGVGNSSNVVVPLPPILLRGKSMNRLKLGTSLSSDCFGVGNEIVSDQASVGGSVLPITPLVLTSSIDWAAGSENKVESELTQVTYFGTQFTLVHGIDDSSKHPIKDVVRAIRKKKQASKSFLAMLGSDIKEQLSLESSSVRALSLVKANHGTPVELEASTLVPVRRLLSDTLPTALSPLNSSKLKKLSEISYSLRSLVALRLFSKRQQEIASERALAAAYVLCRTQWQQSVRARSRARRKLALQLSSGAGPLPGLSAASATSTLGIQSLVALGVVPGFGSAGFVASLSRDMVSGGPSQLDSVEDAHSSQAVGIAATGRPSRRAAVAASAAMSAAENDLPPDPLAGAFGMSQSVAGISASGTGASDIDYGSNALTTVSGSGTGGASRYPLGGALSSGMSAAVNDGSGGSSGSVFFNPNIDPYLDYPEDSDDETNDDASYSASASLSNSAIANASTTSLNAMSNASYDSDDGNQIATMGSLSRSVSLKARDKSEYMRQRHREAVSHAFKAATLPDMLPDALERRRRAMIFDANNRLTSDGALARCRGLPMRLPCESAAVSPFAPLQPLCDVSSSSPSESGFFLDTKEDYGEYIPSTHSNKSTNVLKEHLLAHPPTGTRRKVILFRRSVDSEVEPKSEKKSSSESTSMDILKYDDHFFPILPNELGAYSFQAPYTPNSSTSNIALKKSLIMTRNTAVLNALCSPSSCVCTLNSRSCALELVNHSNKYFLPIVFDYEGADEVDISNSLSAVKLSELSSKEYCNCARTVDHLFSLSNPWSDSEKLIFFDRFLQHPRDFFSIAAHLANKCIADCIAFYYLTKHTAGLRLRLKSQSNAHKRKATSHGWFMAVGAARDVGVAVGLDACRGGVAVLGDGHNHSATRKVANVGSRVSDIGYSLLNIHPGAYVRYSNYFVFSRHPLAVAGVLPPPPTAPILSASQLAIQALSRICSANTFSKDKSTSSEEKSITSLLSLSHQALGLSQSAAAAVRLEILLIMDCILFLSKLHSLTQFIKYSRLDQPSSSKPRIDSATKLVEEVLTAARVLAEHVLDGGNHSSNNSISNASATPSSASSKHPSQSTRNTALQRVTDVLHLLLATSSPTSASHFSSLNSASSSSSSQNLHVGRLLECLTQQDRELSREVASKARLDYTYAYGPGHTPIPWGRDFLSVTAASSWLVGSEGDSRYGNASSTEDPLSLAAMRLTPGALAAGAGSGVNGSSVRMILAADALTRDVENSARVSNGSCSEPIQNIVNIVVDKNAISTEAKTFTATSAAAPGSVLPPVTGISKKRRSDHSMLLQTKEILPPIINNIPIVHSEVDLTPFSMPSDSLELVRQLPINATPICGPNGTIGIGGVASARFSSPLSLTTAEATVAMISGTASVIAALAFDSPTVDLKKGVTKGKIPELKQESPFDMDLLSNMMETSCFISSSFTRVAAAHTLFSLPHTPLRSIPSSVPAQAQNVGGRKSNLPDGPARIPVVFAELPSPTSSGSFVKPGSAIASAGAVEVHAALPASLRHNSLIHFAVRRDIKGLAYKGTLVDTLMALSEGFDTLLAAEYDHNTLDTVMNRLQSLSKCTNIPEREEYSVFEVPVTNSSRISSQKPIGCVPEGIRSVANAAIISLCVKALQYMIVSPHLLGASSPGTSSISSNQMKDEDSTASTPSITSNSPVHMLSPLLVPLLPTLCALDVVVPNALPSSVPVTTTRYFQPLLQLQRSTACSSRGCVHPCSCTCSCGVPDSMSDAVMVSAAAASAASSMHQYQSVSSLPGSVAPLSLSAAGSTSSSTGSGTSSMGSSGSGNAIGNLSVVVQNTQNYAMAVPNNLNSLVWIARQANAFDYALSKVGRAALIHGKVRVRLPDYFSADAKLLLPVKPPLHESRKRQKIQRKDDEKEKEKEDKDKTPHTPMPIPLPLPLPSLSAQSVQSTHSVQSAPSASSHGGSASGSVGGVRASPITPIPFGLHHTPSSVSSTSNTVHSIQSTHPAGVSSQSLSQAGLNSAGSASSSSSSASRLPLPLPLPLPLNLPHKTPISLPTSSLSTSGSSHSPSLIPSKFSPSINTGVGVTSSQERASPAVSPAVLFASPVSSVKEKDVEVGRTSSGSPLSTKYLEKISDNLNVVHADTDTSNVHQSNSQLDQDSQKILLESATDSLDSSAYSNLKDINKSDDISSLLTYPGGIKRSRSHEESDTEKPPIKK